jgi:hypothetical protein
MHARGRFGAVFRRMIRTMMLKRLHKLVLRHLMILVLVSLNDQLLEVFGHSGGNLIGSDYPVVVRIETLEKCLGIWPFGPFRFLCR